MMYIGVRTYYTLLFNLYSAVRLVSTYVCRLELNRETVGVTVRVRDVEHLSHGSYQIPETASDGHISEGAVHCTMALH